MVNGTAKIVLDLGNSETRVTTKFGLSSKGNPRVRMETIDNAFSRVCGLDSESGREVLDQMLHNELYTAENSRVFEHNGQAYCNGYMCENEFSVMAQRPGLYDKWKSVETILALKNAFCNGYLALADFTNTDVENIEVDWEVTMLLPADKIELGGKPMADIVRGIGELRFFMPEFTKKINVKSVKIFPEGFAAFIGVLYEDVGVVREKYRYLVEPEVSTLIVDIGAGTTDIMLVRDGNVVSTSRFTEDIGGNNVHRSLITAVKKKGYKISDKTARMGAERGYIKSGAMKIDIREEVAEAKREVSLKLFDSIKTYFESSMIQIQSIDYLLVVGGGTMHSDVEGIEPISNYIYQVIKDLSENTELVELPDMPDGGKMNPRMANIIGASILAGK